MNEDDQDEILDDSEPLSQTVETDESGEASDAAGGDDDIITDTEGNEYTREEWFAVGGTLEEEAQEPPAAPAAASPLSSLPASPLFTAEEESDLAAELGMSVSQFRLTTLINERVAARQMSAGFAANGQFAAEAQAAPALFAKYGKAAQQSLATLPAAQQSNPKYIRGSLLVAAMEAGPENESVSAMIRRLADDAGDASPARRAPTPQRAAERTPVAVGGGGRSAGVPTRAGGGKSAADRVFGFDAQVRREIDADPVARRRI